MEKNKEELNILLNNTSGNMKNYNEDIRARMKTSDDMEMKKLKCQTDKLHAEITKYEQEFSKSTLLDLIKAGTKISTEEGLKDVIPIDWSEDVLAGKYQNRPIVTTSSKSEEKNKSLVKM